MQAGDTDLEENDQSYDHWSGGVAACHPGDVGDQNGNAHNPGPEEAERGQHDECKTLQQIASHPGQRRGQPEQQEQLRGNQGEPVLRREKHTGEDDHHHHVQKLLASIRDKLGPVDMAASAGRITHRDRIRS